MNSRHASIIRSTLFASLLACTFFASQAQADSNCSKTKSHVSSTNFELLQSAARQGDADAMYWLAISYLDGDFDQGVKWLERASVRGNDKAQNLYAFINNIEANSYE